MYNPILKKAFALSLLCAIVVSGRTQSSSILVDTIFQKNFKVDDGKYVLVSNDSTITYNEGLISSLPSNGEFGNIEFGKNFVYGAKNKLYLLDKNLQIDTNYYVDAKLNSFSYYGQHTKIVDDKIGYIRNDSLFVSNFKNHDDVFVMTNVTLHGMNEKYIWMQSAYSEEDFIYIYENEKLKKLPESFALPETELSNFIFNAPFIDNIHILDLNLKDVVKPEEGYPNYAILGDILILYGEGKSAKFFKGNQQLKFKSEYIDAHCSEYSNLCYLEDKSKKISLMNKNGEFLSDKKYDELIQNAFYMKVSIVKDRFGLHIIDAAHNHILSGDYDDAKYLYKNLFAVEKNGKTMLVDNENNVLANLNYPLISLYHCDKFGSSLVTVTTNSEKIIIDKNGTELTKWSKDLKTYSEADPNFIYFIPIENIYNLSDEHEKILNPSGVYIKTIETKDGKVSIAIDKKGSILSQKYASMMRIINSNHYIVKTLSGKYGIVEINK